MLKQGTMTSAPASLQANSILAKFRAALEDLYGARLERVVLLGSQARGDAGPDSDYDVAVFCTV
jgi:predicted nucleotidyltransferase